MTTHTFKRVIQEVGVAARETPGMYFAGVKAFAAAFGRVVQASAHSASAASTSISKPSTRTTTAGKTTSLRHGKKNRSNASKK